MTPHQIQMCLNRVPLFNLFHSVCTLMTKHLAGDTLNPEKDNIGVLPLSLHQSGLIGTLGALMVTSSTESHLITGQIKSNSCHPQVFLRSRTLEGSKSHLRKRASEQIFLLIRWGYPLTFLCSQFKTFQHLMKHLEETLHILLRYRRLNTLCWTFFTHLQICLDHRWSFADPCIFCVTNPSYDTTFM